MIILRISPKIQVHINREKSTLTIWVREQGQVTIELDSIPALQHGIDVGVVVLLDEDLQKTLEETGQ